MVPVLRRGEKIRGMGGKQQDMSHENTAALTATATRKLLNNGSWVTPPPSFFDALDPRALECGERPQSTVWICAPCVALATRCSPPPLTGGVRPGTVWLVALSAHRRDLPQHPLALSAVEVAVAVFVEETRDSTELLAVQL